jgi:hypothetical protein
VELNIWNKTTIIGAAKLINLNMEENYGGVVARRIKMTKAVSNKST